MTQYQLELNDAEWDVVADALLTQHVEAELRGRSMDHIDRIESVIYRMHTQRPGTESAHQATVILGRSMGRRRRLPWVNRSSEAI